MDADTKKSAAAWSSVLWSGTLAAVKLVVGVMTGSLGILSEALHSALDLVAAGGTVFAVKMAAQPADDEHPYGHGKVENLMALAETLLLLATAGWVILEALERLTSDDPAALEVRFSYWAFGVVILSIVVDVNRAAMLKRVARETRSAALEADAAHFTTDIWSSAAVLLGITGAAMADMALPGSWFHWVLMRADVFASLVVAMFILHVCRELGSEAINNLMDKANSEASDKVRAALAERMPTYPVTRLRVRESGSRYYVDMEVQVPRNLHVDTAHEIADAIETLVASVLDGAETLVHMQPAETFPETPEFIIRRLALTHRFGVHGLVLQHTDDGQFVVVVDLELPADATLESWQVPIEAFRKEVIRNLNADVVALHVEPDLRRVPSYAAPLPDNWQEQVRQAMITRSAPLPSRICTYSHNGERLCIIYIPRECTLTVEESHTRLTRLNKKLTEYLPPVARIIVTYEEA
ncbi:MAG: cation transporter [Akkermansia sp.]|nr:cation transporter [Akkermansia sp.]